jgi:hypothetical protein
MPIWLTATTMAKAQTTAEATLARKLALDMPASLAAPRTTLLSARAARPPITSTTSATTTLGSHSSSWRSTSDTAGRPSASKATTSAISRTNHFTTRPIMPAGVGVHAHLLHEVARPALVGQVVERTERSTAARPFSTSEAMNQPTMRIRREADDLGMASPSPTSARPSWTSSRTRGTRWWPPARWCRATTRR